MGFSVVITHNRFTQMHIPFMRNGLQMLRIYTRPISAFVVNLFSLRYFAERDPVCYPMGLLRTISVPYLPVTVRLHRTVKNKAVPFTV